MKNTTTIVHLKSDEGKNKLFYTIGEDVPRYIVIDSLRLKQIFINLLSNAAKFTKKGEIELKVTVCSKDVQKKTCTLDFSVRDTGIGIKEHSKRRILEPFCQEDYTITKKYGGTGLGLAIIKSLLTKMKSKLKVDSEYGKGSVFSFSLKVPYADEPERVGQISQKKEKMKTTNQSLLKVLIVEDNEINLKVTEHIVNMIDSTAKIYKATTGKKALELYRKHAPDIILLDLRLPDISGYQVSKTIRQENPKIPIIAITAMVVKGEKEKCRPKV